ncbi:hypothetical protein PFZ49_10025, partial [Microbacterium lacticum]|uniref:hypothetical protein n=1 Tax=Microbacterium lacticum TaxID=33885 RepID=UPI003A875511
MEQTVLIPAAYRCPDHDNQQAVIDGVRRLVEVERVVHADQTSGPFRVSVTCPGRAGDPASAHRRVCEGSWRVADLAGPGTRPPPRAPRALGRAPGC